MLKRLKFSNFCNKLVLSTWTCKKYNDFPKEEKIPPYTLLIIYFPMKRFLLIFLIARFSITELLQICKWPSDMSILTIFFFLLPFPQFFFIDLKTGKALHFVSLINSTLVIILMINLPSDLSNEGVPLLPRNLTFTHRLPHGTT